MFAVLGDWRRSNILSRYCITATTCSNDIPPPPGPGLNLHEAGAAPGQGDPDPVPAGQPVHAQPQPPGQVGDISTRVFIFYGKLSLEEIVILANKTQSL